LLIYKNNPKIMSKEIVACEKNGVSGWKFGRNGECHIGIEGKQRAIRDQKIKKIQDHQNKK